MIQKSGEMGKYQGSLNYTNTFKKHFKNLNLGHFLMVFVFINIIIGFSIL